MQRSFRVPSRCAVALVAVLLTTGALSAVEPTQRYIIQCSSNCAAITIAVQQIPGASVDYQFKNVTGLVATLPLSAVPTIESRADVVAMAKDVQVAPPKPVESASLAADSVQQVLASADVTALSGSHPADYEFNNDLIGASTLQAQGITGNGVIVGIIDTGTANNPTVVADLAGSVIGGESFVPASQDPVTSATSTHNGAHGTWVGTMIAGHAIFLFNASSTLVHSLQLHAPNSVIPCSLLGCPTTLAAVPVIGVAPAAKIYALKVFNSAGGGAPNSRIAAAMDRAITLKKNFNNGMPSVPTNPGCGAENNPCVYDSLNIQVVNMSLGGVTLIAARDLEDQLTTEMLKAGITIAVAAGNSGPGAFTAESPGTGPGALCAAAASTAPHERILRDLQFGLGIGDLYRPFDGIQTATFSSRGPSADGRFSVNVSTNGFANFAQGANGLFSLVSGTSFASPTAAGAAALLRQAFPTATATQIRNAIIAGANPHLLADGSGPVDQGSGFLDIPAAAAKLAAGQVSSALPTPGLSTPVVDANVIPLGIHVQNGNGFTTHISNLLPGQVAQYYIRTFENTANLTVTLKNVTPALPPAQQNQFFGDDILLTILDAPTSAAAILAQGFVASDTTVPVGQPQSGLVRVAVQGDETNAGPISADLVVQRTTVSQGPTTASGIVGQGQDDVVQLNVPAGASQLTFQLSWLHDWGFYPTNDIDLIVVDPNGNVILDGATLNSPERVVVNNPVAGTWTAHIQGFQINSGVVNNQDLWSLRVRADGQPVKPVH